MLKPYSDQYGGVRQRPGTSIIQMTRSAVPFPSVADADHHFGALVRALDGLNRPRHDLLIDIRQAVGRNDPEFEQTVGPHRLRLQDGFRRIAVVVSSIAGQLQMKRFAVQDRVQIRVFQDEASALAWLEKKSVGP